MRAGRQVPGPARSRMRRRPDAVTAAGAAADGAGPAGYDRGSAPRPVSHRAVGELIERGRPDHRDRRRWHAAVCGRAGGRARHSAAGHQSRTAGLPDRRAAAGHGSCIGAVLAGECEADRAPLLQARLRRRRQRSPALCPQRCGLQSAGDRPHAGLRNPHRRALCQFARRRWPGGRHRHRLDRLCALLRRPDRRTQAQRAGGGADLPAYLSDRPIVVPGDSRIDIRLIGESDCAPRSPAMPAMLGELRPGGRLEIAPAGRALTLLHPPGYDYFRLLRSKLALGPGRLAHER
jgi:hypothetical protein